MCVSYASGLSDVNLALVRPVYDGRGLIRRFK